MKGFIFCICLVFGFLPACSPSESSKTKDPTHQSEKEGLQGPSVKEMFTIFHAADDSEEVYISTGLLSGGFNLLPGECILLEYLDFSSLTVYFGVGFMDGLRQGGWESLQMVCGLLPEDTISTCQPKNYLIENQGSWFNNHYVLEPQSSQYKDLSKCVPIGDKLNKKNK